MGSAAMDDGVAVRWLFVWSETERICRMEWSVCCDRSAIHKTEDGVFLDGVVVICHWWWWVVVSCFLLSLDGCVVSWSLCVLECLVVTWRDKF